MLLQAGTPDDAMTTTSSGSYESSRQLFSEPIVSTLVIAWCREEPERIGELAIIPDGAPMLVLGRGTTDEEPRMRFYRPQPGRLEPTQPLAAQRLSRRQAEIASHGEHIEVHRVGRCAMSINGVECNEGTLVPGDTLSFRQELVLLCVRRPPYPPPLLHFDTAERVAFGSVDSLGILGESPATWLLREELAFAAKSGRHVLIVGESGTGKELVARAIHRMSSRSSRPLVARNAATLPTTLMDAELFGNLKNYPNPGMADRPGLVGQANGGILFLDEIGELPTELQSHLLRVLDSGGEYQRLGESFARKSDFVLVAATNRDPSELRADLLARFMVTVEVPPLTERREDVPLLVHHLVRSSLTTNPELGSRFVETRADASFARVDAKLVDALLRRDYVGNVRELEALLWKAMGASRGDFIAYDDPLTVPNSAVAEGGTGQLSEQARNREPDEAEIRAALERAAGNVARAAQELGLTSRYALYRRLVKLGIKPSG